MGLLHTHMLCFSSFSWVFLEACSSRITCIPYTRFGVWRDPVVSPVFFVSLLAVLLLSCWKIATCCGRCLLWLMNIDT